MTTAPRPEIPGVDPRKAQMMASYEDAELVRKRVHLLTPEQRIKEPSPAFHALVAALVAIGVAAAVGLVGWLAVNP